MKRIANKVAVSTLLYTMPGNETVKIVDVNHYMYGSSEPWYNVSEDQYTCYTVDCILHDWRCTKIAKAQIHTTAINNGTLLLVIDTQDDEY